MLATVMIGVLLLAVGYADDAEDCTKFGEECTQQEDCCQTGKDPENEMNVCTDIEGKVNTTAVKSCKTFTENINVVQNKCSKLGTSCAGTGECCQKNKNPADQDNVCTDSSGVLTDDNKTCKTYTQNEALKNKNFYTPTVQR